MQSQKNITDTYDKIAAKYTLKFISELDNKPLDKILLKAFADENKEEKIIDLGCGPGQTTKFLADRGCANILGTDISPAMIAAAKELNPQLEFEVADSLNLTYADQLFGAAIAFYSIVNFDYPTVKIAFSQINRVLKPGGQFLFTFHIGDEMFHHTSLLDEKIDIDFYFLDPEKIIKLLNETGLKVIDALIRFPYEQEFQSKRAYIKAAKV
jgi:ubiquinone/menaquinone biosynthesis C-methylase UbiE